VSILRIKNANKEISGKLLFKCVNLSIEEGEKVFLFGRNGSGKTTLMKCIIGEENFDSGEKIISIQRSDIGWLEQDIMSNTELCLYDFVFSGNKELYKVKKELMCLQQKIDRGLWDSVEKKFNDTLSEYINMNGYDFETQINTILKQFGFQQSQFNTPYKNLSGGEKSRAQLSRIQIKQPKMLILDEPTNHLDNEAIKWLEEWVKQYSGTVLFTSHDRDFVDKVADKTYELNKEGTRLFNGGYSTYKKLVDEEKKTQEHLYEKQERQKKELKNTINQYKQWAKKAHDAAGTNPYARKQASKLVARANSKIKGYEKIEAAQIKKEKKSSLNKVHLKSEKLKSTPLIQVKKLKYSYNKKMIISDVSLSIFREDRVAIIGPNGSGKSTLVKLLIGEIMPSSGDVSITNQLKIGYMSQSGDNLNIDDSVIDTIKRLENVSESHARNMLAYFLFRDNDIYKKVGDLSMGERNRLSFIHLYLSECNLLVLDEPNNYLDIETRELIEEALYEFNGPFIVVTHDRYLVRKLANKIFFVGQDDNDFIYYSGTYDEFISTKNKKNSDSEKNNLVQKLEFQLSQQISKEGQQDNNEELINEIKKTKQMIERLKDFKR
jgi:ATPase subunit of ABC transporter with duplicated ATPase domains